MKDEKFRLNQKETSQKKYATQMQDAHQIIIAEDIELNMVLIKAVLSNLYPNAILIEAKTGLEVLEILKVKKVDLVLMDIHMPIMDGLAATQAIRTSEENKAIKTPIVALTAGALKEEKEKCLAAGMNNFLTKPLDAALLKQVLSEYLH
jgi:CheY-like chemotaxis protein